MKITIDGPAGSGKSTVAKILANNLDLTYLDTGAMYRAITYYVLKNNLNLENDLEKIKNALKDIKLEFKEGKIYLDGEDVSVQIRTPEVTGLVSAVSELDFVRSELTKQQQRIAESTDIIMDGRDTGTTVLPNADFKVYLDATPLNRAKRRMLEMGIPETKLEEEIQKIVTRDYKDSHRKISPLTKPEDAFYLNTDDLTVDDVVNVLTEKISEL